MSEPKNREQFVELEYCFKQYYDKYYAPIVDREYAALQKKQDEEFSSRYDPRFAVSDAGAAYNYASNGECGKKGVDDLLENCNNKFLSNSVISDDVDKLVKAWRMSIISEVGVDEYKRLSAGTPTGDLASFYVCNRFQTLFVEQLARKRMPQTSLDYILSKGLSDSLPGLLYGLGKKHSMLDKEVEAMSERFYNPGIASKGTAFAVTFLIDGIATGGYGSLAKVATWLGIDGGIRLVSGALPKGKNFDELLGETIWGDSSVIDQMRKEGKSINPDSSEDIGYLNSILKKPLYKSKFDKKEVLRLQSSFESRLELLSGAQYARGIEGILKGAGFSLAKGNPYPAWMGNMSKEDCYRQSTYFTALAVNMKSKGTKVLKLGGGTTYTLQQVAQRGYDYARACGGNPEEKQTIGESQSLEKGVTDPSIGTASACSIASASADGVSPLVASPESLSSVPSGSSIVNATPNLSNVTPAFQSDGQMNVAPIQQYSGWGPCLDQLGLSGFGEVGKNMGIVLSMLPDVFINMFTGKSSRLRFEDNMLPIGAIIAGMFVKNPLLKLLLVGLGGANLLNKAGHEVLEKRDGRINMSGRRYRKYENEGLDMRISGPAMKGNTLVAKIDGVPSIISINEEAADAYYSGALPLNTLANAILRKFDEQCMVQEHYDSQMRLEEGTEVERSRGLR